MNIIKFPGIVFTVLTTSVLFTQTNSALAATTNLGSLLGREQLIKIGAESIFDEALNRVLNQININEDDSLTDTLFENLNFDTVLIAGAYTFYTSPQNEVRDFNVSVGVRTNSDQVDDTLTRSAMISGTSEKGAPYSAVVGEAKAMSDDGFFFDSTSATVTQAVLTTGNPVLTGEKLYGGGFAFAFIDDEESIEPLSLNVIPLKKDEVEPVPEPLTILGTMTALGIGTAFKRRQSKKQLISKKA